jgi:hypothetical protein
MPFVAGLALLVLLVLMGRGYVRADPRNLAKGFRFTAGVVLALMTVALGVTGRVGLGFITAGIAWFLLFGTVPPWQRTPGPGAAGGGYNQSRDRSGPPRSGAMSRAEALKVLGLEEGATEEQIRAAHKRLILQTHPDKGGTSYLAAKINEAKDVLLKR